MDSTNTSSTTLDVYQMVTDRIIEVLEAGIVPWHKPWTEAGVPKNLVSKNSYRGINLWLLLSLNYERNLFVTWDQLKQIKGSVNAGEHGHILASWRNVKTLQEGLENEANYKITPVLGYYKVFNIAQVRNVPEHMIGSFTKTVHESIYECEAIIHSTPGLPVIKHKENTAFYHIEQDIINMPKQKSFKPIEAYYASLFHQLVHSTGSEKRLGRKSITGMAEFGSEPFSLEELIAELGTAYLCSYTGILDTQIQTSDTYINGWLDKLRKDKRFIMQASGQAQKAADFIMNVKVSESKKEGAHSEEVVEE